MTPLEDIVTAQIAAQGPMSVAEYWAICLFHPVHGYYSTRTPLGAEGDFTTAPEISQMFGEVLGLCLAQAWMDQGQPARFALAELGPGRGTLMADVLRVARSVPGLSGAAQVHLVETSPSLTAQQRDTLGGYSVTWHQSAEDLPQDLPLFALANEFFDALPVRQFVRDASGWRERQIGLEDGQLAFGLSAPAPIGALDHRLEETRAGDLVELCPAAQPIMQTLASRIARNGGAALIFDYGDWRSLGDTLQAMRAHAAVSPLSEPGLTDLTAHVDFEALVADLPCAHTRLSTQGTVLERLGITARAQALAKTLDGSTLDAHIAAHRRLTHPDEMGTVFKTVALYPKGARVPAGYEP